MVGMIETVSGIIFTVFTGVVIVFQGCLAAGVPWGAASMGGKYPGKYPPKMRVVAVFNMALLAFMAAIVLAEADILFPTLKPVASIGIWFVVAFLAIGTVLNTFTPSKIERIWAPVALIQLIASFIIAMS
jgi:drug/metabolite transporter (DMT)-like permease